MLTAGGVTSTTVALTAVKLAKFALRVEQRLPARARQSTRRTIRLAPPMFLATLPSSLDVCALPFPRALLARRPSSSGPFGPTADGGDLDRVVAVRAARAAAPLQASRSSCRPARPASARPVSCAGRCLAARRCPPAAHASPADPAPAGPPDPHAARGEVAEGVGAEPVRVRQAGHDRVGARLRGLWGEAAGRPGTTRTRSTILLLTARLLGSRLSGTDHGENSPDATLGRGRRGRRRSGAARGRGRLGRQRPAAWARTRSPATGGGAGGGWDAGGAGAGSPGRRGGRGLLRAAPVGPRAAPAAPAWVTACPRVRWPPAERQAWCRPATARARPGASGSRARPRPRSRRRPRPRRSWRRWPPPPPAARP